MLLGPPFTRRGITHSVFAAGVAIAVAKRHDQQFAAAVGLGYVSHVLLDATTPMGVMLGYPVSTTNVGLVLHGHAPQATVVIWLCCLFALWYDRRRTANFRLEQA